MLALKQRRLALQTLAAGGIIAYPTEAVIGLGCDPWNPVAVARLLHLKRRDPSKGLILVGADISHIPPALLAPLTPTQRADLAASWPGPISWVIPDPHGIIPGWIRGDSDGVAIRISAHTGVQALCRAWGGLLVSTSANRSGQPAHRTLYSLRRYGRQDKAFGAQCTPVVAGVPGGRQRPSTIRDLQTGCIMRAG